MQTRYRLLENSLRFLPICCGIFFCATMAVMACHSQLMSYEVGLLVPNPTERQCYSVELVSLSLVPYFPSLDSRMGSRHSRDS